MKSPVEALHGPLCRLLKYSVGLIGAGIVLSADATGAPLTTMRGCLATSAPGLEPFTMLVVGSAVAGAAWCGRRLPRIGRRENNESE